MSNQLKNMENILNEAIGGFHQYILTAPAHLNFVSKNLCEMIGICEKELLHETEDLYAQMVHPADREKYSELIQKLSKEELTVTTEYRLMKKNGTIIYVRDTITSRKWEDGCFVGYSVLDDITDIKLENENLQLQKIAEVKRYRNALADVYDKIFEFNRETNTLKCLYSNEGSSFKMLEDVSMQIDEALEKWILHAVKEDACEKIREFFHAFSQNKLYKSGVKPPQITYYARSSSGEMKQYQGIFIKIDEAISYYCCRHIRDTEKESVLRTENDELKKKMKDLVVQFSDGIAAFEVSAEGMVKPLYASENVCEFFGYTEKEWIPLTEKYTPLENFVAHSEARYEDFTELLRTGEAEFHYFDYNMETDRKIKAICSKKESDHNSSRYIMLYQVEDAGHISKNCLLENRTILIRTFGYFDVFVGDRPIAFRNKKSKELLALLVDRKGGYISSEEAIGFLWEDEPANTVTMSRYRKVALRLKNTLEEYGISDIIESVNGKRRIVMEKVQCDLYQYQSGKEEYSQLFKGSYLTNYSWGECTLGELLNDLE